MFLISNFYDFYNKNILNINCSNSFRQISGDFYIIYCFFFLISSFNGNGGVISQINIQCYCLIEECIFNECSVISGYNGGAIYFKCINGEIALNKICAFKCFADNNNWNEGGQFSYLSTKSNSNNIGFYISYIYCAYFISLTSNSILIEEGNQIYKNINSSNNKGYRNYGIHFTKSITLNLLYSNFIENTGHHSCLYFSNSNSILNLNYLNIIKNDSPYDQGIIHSNNKLNIYDTNFKLNKDILFYFQTIGSLIVFNSFINHSSTIFFGNVTLININYNLENKIIINFYSTFNCLTNFNYFTKKNFKNFKKIFIFQFFFLFDQIKF